MICLQPREPVIKTFRVPIVPLLPAISVFINIYLMLQLDVMTWIRFGIWMLIGKYEYYSRLHALFTQYTNFNWHHPFLEL